MSYSIIFNVWSFILFLIAAGVSLLIYRKSECGKKIVHIADLTFFIIFAVTSCTAMFLLYDLTNHSLIGQGFSFVILANFYAAVFNVMCRIYNQMKK